jgi:hypothetical protein
MIKLNPLLVAAPADALISAGPTLAAVAQPPLVALALQGAPDGGMIALAENAAVADAPAVAQMASQGGHMRYSWPECPKPRKLWWRLRHRIVVVPNTYRLGSAPEGSGEG